ncbi:MAG: two-component system chemotaxis family sensor kinase CheA [Puniceicoccaceae bacterium 5H]|nr:MAG: two-component system chemotaxis family sensor kinase CheA [Puniceicoccaceae bacterium 5H]
MGVVIHSYSKLPMSAADFEVLLNRLLTEIMLARAGQDEGMIPVYALLSEWADLDLPVHPALTSSRDRAKSHLDQLLDEAKPWEAETITDLKQWLQWCEDNAATAVDGELDNYTFSFEDGSEPVAEEAPETAPEASEPEAEQPQRIDLESDPELLTEFLSEAYEHLEVVEQQVLTLENDPQDAEGLAAVFRAYHTIKGVAGFLQLEAIQHLAHEVESLLDLARNHTISLDERLITLILQSRDRLLQLTEQIEKALHSGQQPSEVIPVGSLIEEVKQATQAALRGESAPAPEPIAPTPQPQAAEEEPDAATEEEEVAEALEPEIQEVANAPVSLATARAAEALKDSSDNLVTSAKRNATIRVDYEKVSNLMDMVGELVIVESQLASASEEVVNTNQHLQRIMNQLKRITKDLQHTSMALRLVPIKPSFQKVARMVRDLSHSFGKKVEFYMDGEETELDRSVVEQIADPLVHMVRNAIDHGLEPNEQDRVNAGKSGTGHISLKAYQMGSTIVIELSDDGRGLNSEKILKKALERGLIDSNRDLTKEEIYQMIFLPGFSTADKVTDISGRGVGMDVVRRNIEALRGTVQVESQPGQGTTFKIKLPLTTAIIDGLVVRVGNEKFVLPTGSVRQTIRPETKQMRTLYGKAEVVVLRDEIAPVIRLHQEFDIEDAITDPTKGNLVIKSLGPMMRRVRGVSGGAILGDGTIALILDPFSIVAAAADLPDNATAGAVVSA